MLVIAKANKIWVCDYKPSPTPQPFGNGGRNPPLHPSTFASLRHVTWKHQDDSSLYNVISL